MYFYDLKYLTCYRIQTTYCFNTSDPGNVTFKFTPVTELLPRRLVIATFSFNGFH